jgi:hypothetical protein
LTGYQIDRLERERGQLLKQLCRIANQIKAVDIEIERLYEKGQNWNKNC